MFSACPLTADGGPLIAGLAGVGTFACLVVFVVLACKVVDLIKGDYPEDDECPSEDWLDRRGGDPNDE